MPPSGPDLPPEWAAAIDEVCPPTPVDTGVREKRPEIARVFDASSLEHIERLKTLRPRLLRINSENPENSPDFLQMQNIYTENLVPDDVFEDFDNKRYIEVRQKLARGGMFNRMQPLPDELAAYNRHGEYETVNDQILADLLGSSGRPGTYHVMGLFDPSDELQAYLSYRVPPAKPTDPLLMPEYDRQLALYRAHLEHQFMIDEAGRKSKQMTFHSWNIKRLRDQTASMWELDTISSRKGWRHSSYLLFREALRQIKLDLGEIPYSMYCYRFKGFPIKESDGHYRNIGPNLASRDLFERLGFAHMSDKRNKDDVIVRRLSDGQCHEYPTEWSFLYNGKESLQRELAYAMRKDGLLGEDEPLL